MIHVNLFEVIVVEEPHTIVFFYGCNYTQLPKICITNSGKYAQGLSGHPNQITYLPSCIHLPSVSMIGNTSSLCMRMNTESVSTSNKVPRFETSVTIAYFLLVGDNILSGIETRSPFIGCQLIVIVQVPVIVRKSKNIIDINWPHH